MKRKLFLDFDSTICDSSKSIISLYPKFDRDVEIMGYPSYTLKWNFCDVFPNVKKHIIHNLFDSKLFFDNLELFDGVYETLQEISDMGVEIIIVSIGTPNNIKFKMDYINKHLPFCTFIPLIQNGTHKFDKSIINMDGGIFVEDRVDILETSNAAIKILYKNNGYDYEWARGWQGLTQTKWDENFKSYLKFFLSEV